jgi:hypothetical protein
VSRWYYCFTTATATTGATTIGIVSATSTGAAKVWNTSMVAIVHYQDYTLGD